MDNDIDRISQCESLPQLWRLMLGFFRERGFGGVCYFAYGVKGWTVPGDNVRAFLHGFSPDVARTYLEADYQRLDVAPRLSMAKGRPVQWSQAWTEAEPNEEERGFLELMRAANLGDGYHLPCYGPFGRDGLVGIGLMAEAAQTDDLALSQMHIAAQAAHLKICALTAADGLGRRALSAREKEILDWVARGKSNGVIADILNISSGTVDTYLRRIYEKLDVSDRTSAAVRGVGMGLIAA